MIRYSIKEWETFEMQLISDASIFSEITLRKHAHANIQGIFSAVKIENFVGKIWIFLIF